MKVKELFDSYELAIYNYENEVVPKYGATRLPWGFGKWLWLDVKNDEMEYWSDMERTGILTQEGRKMLSKARKGGA